MKGIYCSDQVGDYGNYGCDLVRDLRRFFWDYVRWGVWGSLGLWCDLGVRGLGKVGVKVWWDLDLVKRSQLGVVCLMLVFWFV